MKNNPFKLIFALSLMLNFILLKTAGLIYNTKTQYSISPIDYKFQFWHYKYSDQLSLNPEQWKMMKEKLKSFYTNINDKRQALIKKRLALINLLRAETPNMNAINTAISQISSMQEDIEKEVVMHIIEGKDILDKNQQQKFLDQMEKAMMQKRHSVFEQEYPRF
jgi:Spy/CpxP family protein refolding chaperone